MIQITTPFETPPAEGEAIEVAHGVFWMRLPLPMALDHVNVYAIDDGDGWCIVDTGFYSKRGVAIWENLIGGPLSGKPVTKVLLTHHHPDHIGMVGWFQSRGAHLLTSRTAFLLGRMLILDVQEEWPKPTAEFYQGAGMPSEMMEQRLRERPYNFADIAHPIELGYTRLIDGQRLSLGGRNWQIIMGDGHAPEHVTLWSEDGDLAIVGDQIIHGISSNIAVHATEPEADPLDEWMASCARFATVQNNHALVLSGHKLPFVGASVRAAQLVDHHVSALVRLLDFITEPRAAAEAFDLLYGRSLKPTEYGFALTEAVAHMNHLWSAGLATRVKGADGVWRFQSKPGVKYGKEYS